MGWKRKMQGGVIGFIGFMLSPLSWWNDLFVNVPLAIGFGWLVSLLYRPAFEFGVILGYWITNLLGFILMQKGAQKLLTGEPSKPYSRRDLLRDIGVSLLYTVLIFTLVRLRVIQPIREYFKAE